MVSSGCAGARWFEGNNTDVNDRRCAGSVVRVRGEVLGCCWVAVFIKV